MRRIIIALSMGLTLIGMALPSLAATVSGLYEAQVPVAGEDTDSRNQAIAEALGLVLVKVTGRDPAPGGVELGSQAARYVQQFRYRRETTPEGESQTELWVRFDKTGLDRALRDRGLPLWGSSRPGVLVWLGVDIAGQRRMVGVEAGLSQPLHEAAAVRGIPLQLPLLDLEDQAALSNADLWSDYAPAVQQASSRYSQPLVLTGRLRQVAVDHWSSRWTLYEGESSQTMEINAADAQTIVRQAVGRTAELLAARYAPAGGQNGPEVLHLKIVGIRGLQDYARAMKLVSEREVVERVVVRSAEADAVVLEVLARGGREALARVLDLVRGLERQPDPVPAAQSLPVYVPTPEAEPLPAASADTPPVESAPVEAATAETATVATVPAPQEGGAVLAEPLPAVEPVVPAEPMLDLIYRLTP